MARWPRIVVCGQPLPIIQRDNNRQTCLFADDDYQRKGARLEYFGTRPPITTQPLKPMQGFGPNNYIWIKTVSTYLRDTG
jgi:hypothetical protein